MNKIETLRQFYELMRSTKGLRSDIVKSCLKKTPVSRQSLTLLNEKLQALEDIPRENGTYSLLLDKKRSINLDLNYEINELKKDIFFLEHPEDEFFTYMDNLHENFSQQAKACIDKLKGIHFKCFITDRDGTVNNYCGRYASSIQSVYNAVFLTRFARNHTENSIILTSAPLDNTGLVDISVAPENVFIHAGSKGREYFNKNGERRQFPIKKDKQAKLNELNKRLSELVRQPEYEMFSLIGSGLQFKFGQTTIARQDISGTIPENESQGFLAIIKKIVAGLDPSGNLFRIEDTGKDIEIILTIENDENLSELKDFDKGDGVNFLDNDLNLNMQKGPNLICGDTKSDLPMISASMDKTDATWAIFVTQDKKLEQAVFKLCPNALIVSQPDILVTILNNL